MNIDTTVMRYNTTRLCLRPFSQADFNDVYKYSSNTAFCKLINWQLQGEKETNRQRFDAFVSRKDALAIDYCGEIIGFLKLSDEKRVAGFEQFNCLRLDFALASDYWGQGLMVEALKVLCDDLFANYGMDYIFSANEKENNQLRRVFQKGGFQFFADYCEGEQAYQINVITRRDYLESQEGNLC
ncbi:MAG: GNAT family N-acetyltransferase [Erysipelotrichaceae bacterium]